MSPFVLLGLFPSIRGSGSVYVEQSQLMTFDILRDNNAEVTRPKSAWYSSNCTAAALSHAAAVGNSIKMRISFKVFRFVCPLTAIAFLEAKVGWQLLTKGGKREGRTEHPTDFPLRSLGSHTSRKYSMFQRTFY